MQPTLQVVLLSEYGKEPTRMSQGAAGYDLYAAEEKSIEPGETELIPLHIAIGIPPGWVGSIRDRSSLGARGIHVFAGTVDSDYTGPVFVALHNATRENFFVNKGDRIAQLVVHPVLQTSFHVSAQLPQTQRGQNGFGSTGK